MLLMTQLHIDIARNSTDDFNLFHDKSRWHWLRGNPFEGPIALGFQLGCFIEYQCKLLDMNGASDIDPEQFRFSAYEFSFANCVRPDDEVSLSVKSGKWSNGEGPSIFSRRLILKANKKPAIIGHKREANDMTLPLPSKLPPMHMLNDLSDRDLVPGTKYFLKRKYMIVGNAKNFLASAGAEQSLFIDEFADKVDFPEMYPLGLISSALLERAVFEDIDLISHPMIYASQKLCIDKRQLEELRSNDAINILVGPDISADANEFGPESSNKKLVIQECVAYGKEEKPLFIAKVCLIPLNSLIKAKSE
ncbi:MAG: hypothetical protein ACI9O6_000438 [Glaciecola sp.]|jgi:hypothetical protein